MARQKLIHEFLVGQIFDKLVLSDTTKLTLDRYKSTVSLKSIGTNTHLNKAKYSTDTDLTVTFPAFNPKAVKQWLGFCALPTPAKQPTGTSIQYRLHDGTNPRYWNSGGGGSWDVASTDSHWTSESDISANFATFPATSQTLQIIANLRTTDKYSTPTLFCIGVLMDCEIEYLESLLAGSFLPLIESECAVDLPVVSRGPGTTVFNMSFLRRNFPSTYSVIAAYNHTDDPGHDTNLLSAHNAASGDVTLTTAIPQEDEMWLVLRVTPVCHLNLVSTDYTEVAELPAVVADSFTLDSAVVDAKQWVWGIDDNAALARTEPNKLMIDFRMLIVVGDEREQLAMMEKILALGANHPTLTWEDLDQEVSMDVRAALAHESQPSSHEVHQAVFRVILRNVYLWLTPERSEAITQRINLIFS